MLIIQSVFIGLLIVAGQTLWKIGITKIGSGMSLADLFSSSVTKIFLSPWILAGILAYGLATIAYMVLLSKYEYTNLQTLVGSSSLVFTFLIASIFFEEKISLINICGLILLIVAIILIIRF